MILKVCCVLQFFLIQIISAQISARDLENQNAAYSRFRRQTSNQPVDLPGTGHLPVKGFENSLPFKNDRSFGNFARGSGSSSNLALNSGLPRSTFNIGLPNSSPISSLNFPFPNMNVMPQNRPFPNINGVNNKGLLINNIPNELPSFNNLPNGLPSFNNIPKGLPGFNNIPSGFPDVNHSPRGLPINIIPNGLPSFNKVPNILPSFNNIPNSLPGTNNIPNGLPGVNPSRLPINIIPNGLPSFNNLPNGLPHFNNIPNVLPGFENIPSGLPGVNNIPNGLPGINNIPGALPGFNTVQNGSPNFYHPPGANKFQNLIDVPAGYNLPGTNSLPNINNVRYTNGLRNLNNCGFAYPVPLKNRLPLNNLQSGNILPPINNKLPFLNNLRSTEIGIGNGFADINRFPRNDQSSSNVLPNANYLENGNRLTQQVSDELSNINGFSVVSNTPAVIELSSNAQANNMFSSINSFPNSNGVSNFAGEVQNINTMQLNNGMLDISNFQNYNVRPISEQRFVNDINNIEAINNFQANPIVSNPIVSNGNSRLLNAINNGMPLSNGGYLNDILFANNAVNALETQTQNSDVNEFSSNDVQFGNVQGPVNDWHYETVQTQLPDTQIVLPEGVHMITNVPSEYQSGLMSSSLSLAQELVGNLQIEGMDNMPFLNGLPVAGITETITVLNRK